ncbi:MAG: lipid II flippase MurJ, partial [Anaerolineae bacterium]
AWLAYRGTLGRGLRLVLVLLIPAIVALFVMAEPIIRLLFEHGSFVAADTLWTARALRLYLLGLGFAGVDFLFNYAFYARQDTRTPAIVGVVSVVVYLVVALSLLRPLGFLGLVLADSTKHMSHAIIMLILLLRAIGALRGQGIMSTGFKALLAALAMGLALSVLRGWLGGLAGSGLVGKVIVVGGAAGSGIAIYGALLWLLGVEEVKIVSRMVLRRLIPPTKGL